MGHLLIPDFCTKIKLFVPTSPSPLINCFKEKNQALSSITYLYCHVLTAVHVLIALTSLKPLLYIRKEKPPHLFHKQFLVIITSLHQEATGRYRTLNRINSNIFSSQLLQQMQFVQNQIKAIPLHHPMGVVENSPPFSIP